MYSYEANGRGNTSATDAKLLERKSQFINLPAVTPEDNGKVLGVEQGKWQPVNAGGGGGANEVVFEINVEVDEEYGDRTWTYQDGQGRSTLSDIVRENDGKDIVITCVNIATGEVDERYVISKARGATTYADYELKAYKRPAGYDHGINLSWMSFFENGGISQGSYTAS